MVTTVLALTAAGILSSLGADHQPALALGVAIAFTLRFLV